MSALSELTSAAPGLAARSRPGSGVLLLVPALVVLALMFVVPLSLMMWRSISDPSFGTQNYEWFFGTGSALRTMARTLGVAFIVTVVCLVLAYPVAYLMTVCGPRARLGLTLLVLLPFWTSLMVRTFAWIVLLQDTGVINRLLGIVGVGPLHLIHHTSGVVIGMTQILLPFMVLPLYTVMSGIDRRLLAAAEGLGARPAVAFARVYLPLSTPGVLAGSLTVFITALGFYVAPSLLGSPDRALISQQIYTQVNGLLQWGRGGAMGVVLLLVTLLLLGASLALLRVASRRGA